MAERMPHFGAIERNRRDPVGDTIQNIASLWHVRLLQFAAALEPSPQQPLRAGGRDACPLPPINMARTLGRPARIQELGVLEEKLTPRLAPYTIDVLQDVARLNEPLEVRPVGTKNHTIFPHQIDHLAHVISPEGVDPHVPQERLPGRLAEVT